MFTLPPTMRPTFFFLPPLPFHRIDQTLSRGQWVVTWASTIGGPGDLDVYYAYSSNNGVTFSSPLTVNPNATAVIFLFALSTCSECICFVCRRTV